MDGILARQAKEGKPLAEVVEAVVKTKLNDPALGVSGLMLKDPMAKRMIARAEKLGVAGKYVSLMKEMVKAAQKLSKEPVDIDLLGATGAVMFDLGFTPEATWGILAVTRAFATGAHYCEEIEREEPVRLGQTLTPKEWYDGPEDRPVPTLEERKKVAKCDGGPDARGVEDRPSSNGRRSRGPDGPSSRRSTTPSGRSDRVVSVRPLVS